MALHILENDALRITVADAGAELIGVLDKSTGKERIWSGDPAVWNRHAPILFPFVGKVVDGKYRLGGREYPMKTQHGFARDLDFACLEESADFVTHCLTATDWTLERYPFDFRLSVTHRLVGLRQLQIEWIVENPGDVPMRFGIGGHPGFLLPDCLQKEDCLILFPGKETLRYIGTSPAGYALPRQKTLSLKDGCARYQADIPETWIFEDHQVDAVGIAGPDGKPFVVLRCRQFPMLAVWANPKGPFICLEPWFGRTDDEGFHGDISEKKGMVTLDAGTRKEISYTIEFPA